ncbi:MAG: cytochrome c oxidase subunit II [Actinomycetota bacterium]|nr:cytochrome c oxidase subunit II [Actinomycetota bacterium]
MTDCARSSSPLRLIAVAAPAALFGALLAAQTATAGVLSPQAESPNAKDIKFLYDMVAIVGLIIFVVVEGLLFYALWKYRAKKGAVAAQIHGNTRLEIGWTVAAALILVVITIVTFIKMPAIINPAPSDIDANGNPVAGSLEFASTDQPDPPAESAELNIKVDGQQYVWRYQYPGPKVVFSYEEMVVPVGMTVTLDISSDDVAHSFWIPALGGKMDAIPGYINKLWFKTTRPATYVGQCAELCGRNHANMYSRVRAVPFDEYQKWYDQQAADIEQSNREAPKQRQAIEKAQGEQSIQGGGSAGGASDDQ